MVKGVARAFCSIQYLFIRDIRAKFGVPDLPQSPYIGGNSDGGISEFRISCQSIINKNCPNPRTSNNIDMKLGPVTKLYMRNTKSLKKIGNDVISINCDVIVIFTIYGQLEQSESRIPDAWSVKTINSLIVTFYLTKIENKTKKSVTQLS